MLYLFAGLILYPITAARVLLAAPTLGVLKAKCVSEVGSARGWHIYLAASVAGAAAFFVSIVSAGDLAMFAHTPTLLRVGVGYFLGLAALVATIFLRWLLARALARTR